MKNLTQRDRIILIVLSVILVIFVYYEIFFSPMMNKISEKNDSITKKAEQVEQIKKMQTENVSLKKKIEDLKGKYEQDKGKIPVDIRDPDIENHLNVIAGENNVQVTSIGFANGIAYVDEKSKDKKVKVEKGTLMYIPVTFAYKGDYNGVLNCLKSMEEAQRISEIKTTRMVVDDTGTLKTSISANYYFLLGDDEDRKTLQYNLPSIPAEKTDLFR